MSAAFRRGKAGRPNSSRSCLANWSHTLVYPQSSTYALTHSGSGSPLSIIVVAAPIETPCTTIKSSCQRLCATSVHMAAFRRSSHPICIDSPSLWPWNCWSKMRILKLRESRYILETGIIETILSVYPWTSTAVPCALSGSAAQANTACCLNPRSFTMLVSRRRPLSRSPVYQV